MTLNQLFREGEAMLTHIDNSSFDARALLMHVCDIDLHMFALSQREEVCAEKVAAYLQLCRRRANREPLAYIIGRQEFYSLPFICTPDVLVPRQDTELLVDIALSLNPATVADIGTGSGAIAVAIAKNLPHAKVTAFDISLAALSIAQQNEALNKVDIIFNQCDIMREQPSLHEFDLIVSNPPYIPASDIASLMPEVHREPAIALDGGDDGLDFYRRIIAIAGGARILFEAGIGQSHAIASIAAAHNYTAGAFRDTHAIERAILLQRRK